MTHSVISHSVISQILEFIFVLPYLLFDSPLLFSQSPIPPRPKLGHRSSEPSHHRGSASDGFGDGHGCYGWSASSSASTLLHLGGGGFVVFPVRRSVLFTRRGRSVLVPCPACHRGVFFDDLVLGTRRSSTTVFSVLSPAPRHAYPCSARVRGPIPPH